MTHRAARGAEVPSSSVLETERLTLRRLTFDDDQFIFELLNDPAWIEFIGDKGVRTLADARDYIRNGPMAMYEREGFGLWLTQRKSDDAPIGMCGLIKRDTLQDVDIGFAFGARKGRLRAQADRGDYVAFQRALRPAARTAGNDLREEGHAVGR